MKKSKRILFVCHGNICRSPMAEVIFRNLVEQRGLSQQFSVASAATSSEEIWNGIGNPVYPQAKAELAKHGLSAGDKRAVQLCRNDYSKYDLFVGMDENNLRNMHRIFGDDPEGKVRKLRSKDVEDPWYTGRFDLVFREICDGCEKLLAELYKNQ